MKTESWPQILVGSSHGRNCSRTLKGKKLERRLITDIFFATECLPTKYHKLSLDHFADEYMNLQITLNSTLLCIFSTKNFAFNISTFFT